MWRMLHCQGTAWLATAAAPLWQVDALLGQAAIRLVLKARLFCTHTLPPPRMRQVVLNLLAIRPAQAEQQGSS